MDSPSEQLWHQLYEPSYFSGSPIARQLLSELTLSIPPENLAQLKTLAFVIVKPDAIVSGKCSAVIEYLRRSGLKAVEATPLLAPALRDFEELYKFNLTLRNEQNQIGSWWVNCQLYTLAPSLLLMLECPGNPANVHQILGSIKGPSSPHAGRRGQLRFDLRACNKALNMIHCSDDPLSTAREYLIFNPLGNLRQLLSDRLNPGSAEQLAASRRNVDSVLHDLECSQNGTRIADTNVFCALARFSLLFTQLIRRAAMATSTHSRTLAFNSAVASISELPLLANSGGGGGGRYCQSAETVASAVESNWQERCADLQECLVALLRPKSLTEDVLERCFTVLTANRVSLSAWDTLVLRSTIHYRADFLAVLSDDFRQDEQSLV